MHKRSDIEKDHAQVTACVLSVLMCIMQCVWYHCVSLAQKSAQ